MKIIFEGKGTIIVDDFTLEEVEDLKKQGKEVYIADGNIIVE